MSVDYMNLIEKIVKDKYLLHRINDTLVISNGATMFTSFDLKITLSVPGRKRE